MNSKIIFLICKTRFNRIIKDYWYTEIEMYVVSTIHIFSLPIFEIVHRKIRSKELNQNREIALRDFTIEKQIARSILCNISNIYQTPFLCNSNY